MESPIQPLNTQLTNKIENIEREPKVEHLFFSNNKSVLIKTSFPWRDTTAVSFVLILEPTQKTFDEQQRDLTSKYYQDGMTKDVEDATRRAFEDMNRPVVLNGVEGAQKWFDYSSFQSTEERRMVANFLGVEDKGI
jgi:hypothetical protein